MRFTPCNYDEYERAGIGFKKTKNYELLDGFVKSGHKCAVVEGIEGINTYYFAANLRRSIKCFHINGVRVSYRKGTVYLINECI